RRSASASSTSTRGFRSGATGTSRWSSAPSAPSAARGARRAPSTCAALSGGRCSPTCGRSACDCEGGRRGGRGDAAGPGDALPHAERPRFRVLAVSRRRAAVAHRPLHPAWPDRAFEGQRAAFDDAALLVDDKWERAFEKAARVRAGFARLLGDREGSLALANNTHELLVRFLSALPLLGGTERRQRPRIVTTDAEFHSARRQLDRLAEAGVELVRVAAAPAASAGERVAAAIDDRTAAAIVSTVFFTDAGIAGGLAT